MNNYLKIFVWVIALAVATGAIISCSEDGSAPDQPDFILTTLPDNLSIVVGEEFKFSVPDEGNVDSWEWTVPALLHILSGQGTNNVTVVALEEGTVRGGSIYVVAKNSKGVSYSRKFFKMITVIPRPPKPAYISAATAGSNNAVTGSVVFEKEVEFTFFVPEESDIMSYTWNVPQSLTIVSGQGTRQIIVKAIQRGVIVPNTISILTVDNRGIEITETYPKIINITPLEDPDGNVYPTKRYGDKVWMIDNLRWNGADNNLGRVYADNAANEIIHGRLYTWHESMTGISQCPASENPYIHGYEGTDNAGNVFVMGESNSYGAQIRGICPEGWHMPNPYDRYDLFTSIADGYGLRKNSLNEIGATLDGGGLYVPTTNERETNPRIAMSLTTHGGVGGYLKGGEPGNPWTNTSLTYYYAGRSNPTFVAGNWPNYYPERMQIGFNLLPSGQHKGATYSNLGAYSYHWSSYAPDNNNAWRTTVAGTNTNWSSGDESKMNANSIRCVADY